MKTPIKVKDIRKGDLIRWEYDFELLKGHKVFAVEYHASCDGGGWYATGRHYLLDRPEPPVMVPAAALRGLRATAAQGCNTVSVPGDVVRDFLKAVDVANEAEK